LTTWKIMFKVMKSLFIVIMRIPVIGGMNLEQWSQMRQIMKSTSTMVTTPS